MCGTATGREDADLGSPACPTSSTAPRAIEQARVAAAAQARRIPALADLLGAGAADLGVDGLASGGALTGALADLRAALEGELTAGGARMAEVDRALDATLRSMQGADADGRERGALP